MCTFCSFAYFLNFYIVLLLFSHYFFNFSTSSISFDILKCKSSFSFSFLSIISFISATLSSNCMHYPLYLLISTNCIIISFYLFPLLYLAYSNSVLISSTWFIKVSLYPKVSLYWIYCSMLFFSSYEIFALDSATSVSILLFRSWIVWSSYSFYWLLMSLMSLREALFTIIYFLNIYDYFS